MMSRGKLLILLNISFAVIAVIGQVGQNVSLPLWTGATSALRNPNCSDNASAVDVNGPEMDPYFVLSCASFSFVVIFGTISLVQAIVQAFVNTYTERPTLTFITKEELRFPQWQLMLIGFFDALNGVFVVFASSPKRTAPFLQAILGNFMIPLTILFRLILLRKRPTLLKLICAGMVIVGLILSLIPVITGMDEDAKSGNKAYLKQSRVSQILWPFCFMFGFVPAALMNVIEEKSLKDSRKINLFYFLFITSLYQLITVGFLFWVDIVPGYGFTNGSVKQFGENYWFAIQCFFGQEGCNYKPGLTGSMFIAMYIVSYVGGGLLIRYAEGATYLAIVQAFVTPLGALFWSIFENSECGVFSFHPNAGSLTYFSIGGIVILVPAIFLYNIGTFGELHRILLKIIGREPPPAYESPSKPQYGEQSPLLTATAKINDSE